MKRSDVKPGMTLIYRRGPLTTKVKVLAIDQRREYWGGPHGELWCVDDHAVLVQPILKAVMGQHDGWIRTIRDARGAAPLMVHYRSLHDDWDRFYARHGERIVDAERRFRRDRAAAKRLKAARDELVPLFKKAGIRDPQVTSAVTLTYAEARKLLKKAGIS